MRRGSGWHRSGAVAQWKSGPLKAGSGFESRSRTQSVDPRASARGVERTREPHRIEAAGGSAHQNPAGTAGVRLSGRKSPGGKVPTPDAPAVSHQTSVLSKGKRGEMNQAQLREAQENVSLTKRVAEGQAAARDTDRRVTAQIAGRGSRRV